jgi:hypothetical protein
MAQPQLKLETLNRDATIAALRNELARRANGEMSICRLAAEKGIFCRGFHRFSEEELRQRYDWIARRPEVVTRGDIEEIADRWQLARQEVDGVPTACDVQQIEHDSCNGWSDFTNDELSRFMLEVAGRRVLVAG